MNKALKNILKIIIPLVIVYLIISSIYTYISSIDISEKATQIFGNDYCEEKHWVIAGDALTPWTCKLCGYTGINPDTDTPEICDNCARLTGRCTECGKLKNNI